jgi:hypothetical protein
VRRLGRVTSAWIAARCHQAPFSAFPTYHKHSRQEIPRKMFSIRVEDNTMTLVSNFVRGKSGRHIDFNTTI